MAAGSDSAAVTGSDAIRAALSSADIRVPVKEAGMAITQPNGPTQTVSPKDGPDTNIVIEPTFWWALQFRKEAVVYLCQHTVGIGSLHQRDDATLSNLPTYIPSLHTVSVGAVHLR